MKNGWRVILIIAALAILLGAVCVGVGILTGAETDRILQSLNNDYHLNTYVQVYTDYLGQLWRWAAGLFG
ncbi:MAG: hypothetical protein IKS55_03990 [Oscillospiraceae bacterium]|nr:hypothetical protein [Oscillospiraceae bacterium]